MGGTGFESQYRLGISPLLQKSGPVLGPTQPKPPIQWVPGFSLGSESPAGVKLTTHRHLVPMLRITGAVTLLPLCTVMSLDLKFFTFVPLYPDFPACHLLRHSFLSAHLPSKEEESRHSIALWFLFVCLVGWFGLVGWLVGLVWFGLVWFVHLHFGAIVLIFTKRGMDEIIILVGVLSSLLCMKFR